MVWVLRRVLFAVLVLGLVVGSGMWSGLSLGRGLPAAAAPLSEATSSTAVASGASLEEAIEPASLRETGRVSGPDRYATAAAIARRSFPEPFAPGSGVVYLARGDLFTDALVGGTLTDGPVLLVRACSSLPSVVRAEIERLNPARVVALGGGEAVCEEVLTVAAEGRDSARLAGGNRYETAAIIAEHAFPQGPVAEVYVATGDEASPDAIAGGTLTAGPILLARPDGGVPTATAAQVARLDPYRVVALGGTTVVPETTLDLVAAGRDTDRLGGANRYETAVVIGAHAFPHQSQTLYLARGDVFADAVAAGSLTDGPVLLLRGDCAAPPAVVAEFVQSTNPQLLVAIGGTEAVCDEVLDAIAGLITEPDPLVITTTDLPDASLNEPYNAQLQATGGAVPYTWEHTEGTLPTGIALTPDGALSGIPTSDGYHEPTFQVSDSDGLATTVTLPLAVIVGQDPDGTPVTSIHGGSQHSCAVTVDGAAKCWGNNEVGQLGDGTTMDRHAPVDVVGLGEGTTTTLSAGRQSTCALTVDGAAKCWGYNDVGQLGDGTTTDQHVPVDVVGLGPGTTTTISADDRHACAVTLDGSAKCWGNNGTGQLGDGTNTHSHSPVDVVGLGQGATATITAGEAGYTCAVTVDGAAKCWGYNEAGRLGDGTYTNRWTPVDVVGLGPGTTTTITAAYWHTCAMTVNGTAKCWGWNVDGNLGDGTNTTSPIPVDVVGLGQGITTISASGDHTCAVTIDAGVKCWGGNWSGELGDGTMRNRNTPVNVIGLGPGTTTIAASGAGHTCAVTVEGAAKCWGWNSSGQLGDGTDAHRLSPVGVLGLHGIGNPHPLVIVTADLPDAPLNEPYDAQLQATGGTVPYTWEHTDGTLPTGIALTPDGALSGTPTSDGYHEPTFRVIDSTGATAIATIPLAVVVGELPDGTPVSSITAGRSHTCAVTVDGAAKCWGGNGLGQLGDGTTTDRRTPVDVVGLGSGTTATISAGFDHTCAVTSDGAAKCWGWNVYGGLGDGTTSDRWTPVDVVGLGSGTTDTIAPGGLNHTCALTVDGAVKCWGYNSHGQLGDGTCSSYYNDSCNATDRWAPVDVVGLGSGTTTTITTGGRHTCAVTVDGAAKCWGDTIWGQVGNGTSQGYAELTPVDVIGLGSGTTATLAARIHHTCAVTLDGAAKCWGYNGHGQLGDGTNYNPRSTPVDVVGLGSGTTATLTAFEEHTCAVTRGGVAKCWGYNSHGQLGDGTTSDRWTPVDVVGLGSGTTATIAAGWDHTCAVTVDGVAKCWGNNESGKLGDGTITDQWTPIDVVGLHP